MTSVVGRFAPTPSGPLHFGSLVAALASWLEAKKQKGLWVLRIDDLDPLRIESGSVDSILACLEVLGLEWDQLTYQSTRQEAYQAALEQLWQAKRLYGCSCSRKQLAQAPQGPEGPIYPGTCRHTPRQPQLATRFLTKGLMPAWEDQLWGTRRINLEKELGDFVVWRADGVCSYHLATVIDDQIEGVTEILRGSDLLLSADRQMALRQILGLPTPKYAHLPLATDFKGQKLSKQSGAMPVKPGGAVLVETLAFLKQNPPANLKLAGPKEVLNWGLAHWSLDQLKPKRG